MKTKIMLLTLVNCLFVTVLNAQQKTIVNATSSEISDNLDLRAVASLFGDSRDLNDFENRLNDPKTQISNLDLNNDNQVDYLRVIETIESNTHIIVIQSVLGRDKYQDVATIEVQRDKRNKVQVQVVGDNYIYGSNYIYEPVYVNVPVIYNYFWTPRYTPYCSAFYWGYYPNNYYAWNPYPIFRYRYNVGLCINFNYQYNYVNYRRCQVAYNDYYGRRANYYESLNPNYSFRDRNSGYSNRHDLEQVRTRHDVAFNDSPRNATTGPRNFDNPRSSSVTPREGISNSPRSNVINSPRSFDANTSPRENTVSPRTNVNDSPRNNSVYSPRSLDATSSPREISNSPRNSGYNASNGNYGSSPRSYETPPMNESPRNPGFSQSSNTSPRSYDAPRMNESPRNSEYSQSSNASPRSYDAPQINESPRNFGYSQSSNASPRQSDMSPRGNTSFGGGRR
ncbi:MAG: hypothetical protein H7239_06745 [Flavobacterium sp.]|nr:hypothetical protein [Flavobacterium sp.]